MLKLFHDFIKPAVTSRSGFQKAQSRPGQITSQIRIIVNSSELYLRQWMIIYWELSRNKSTSEYLEKPGMRPWSPSSHIDQDCLIIKPTCPNSSSIQTWVSCQHSKNKWGQWTLFGVLKHNEHLLKLISQHFRIVHL